MSEKDSKECQREANSAEAQEAQVTTIGREDVNTCVTGDCVSTLESEKLCCMLRKFIFISVDMKRLYYTKTISNCESRKKLMWICKDYAKQKL